MPATRRLAPGRMPLRISRLHLYVRVRRPASGPLVRRASSRGALRAGDRRT
jgi:hypothetical protein